MAEGIERPPATVVPPPQWVMVTGVLFIALGLLFLMSLVVASLFEMEVPCASRALVVFILALVVAAGFGFLGGAIAVNGNLPRWMAIAQDSPIVFGVTGGIGAFVLTLVLGHVVYGCANRPALPPTILSVTVDGPNPSGQMLMTIRFSTDGVPRDADLELSLASDEQFLQVVFAKTLTGWQGGVVTLPLPIDEKPQMIGDLYLRLRAVSQSKAVLSSDDYNKQTVRLRAKE